MIIIYHDISKKSRFGDHFDIVPLIYNTSKLAVDRINTALNQQVT